MTSAGEVPACSASTATLSSGRGSWSGGSCSGNTRCGIPSSIEEMGLVPGRSCSARIRALTSGSDRRRACSCVGRSASGRKPGRPVNACLVRRPISRPSGRQPTWGTSRAPSALCCSTLVSSSRHCSGSFEVCPNVKVQVNSWSRLSWATSSSSPGHASAPQSEPAVIAWYTPAPSGAASRTAWAMISSSSAVANVPGTGRPSTAVCRASRFVEKPSAPARILSETSSAMPCMSCSVAGSLAAPRCP